MKELSKCGKLYIQNHGEWVEWYRQWLKDNPRRDGETWQEQRLRASREWRKRKLDKLLRAEEK